jgi:hypothetical protein
MAVVGLVSIALALSLPPGWVALAGYFYFVIGVYFTIAGMLFGRRERRLKRGRRGWCMSASPPLVGASSPDVISLAFRGPPASNRPPRAVTRA